MAVVTIVGAGMMGSALTVPAADNGHTLRLVGTPLDEKIVECVLRDGTHPTLQRKLPQGVAAFKAGGLRQALEGADMLICGVSSFGVDWFAHNVLPHIPPHMPVLAVTKGLAAEEDGRLTAFPRYYERFFKPGQALSLNAIGGPCTSYELADRHQTSVVFCGDDEQTLRRLRGYLATDYYHISLSKDIMGVECAVALKNAYALAVSLAVGMAQASAYPFYNTQAALFAQGIREMRVILKLLGAGEENVVYGAGDLYVTIFGGRTRRLGTLLGKGIPYARAKEMLDGITLESVAITRRVAQGLIKMGRDADCPLLMHINDVLNGAAVAIPWDKFRHEAF